MADDGSYWKHVVDQILKAVEFRDRLIVTGAAGTLLLSITFVHDIAPEPRHWTLFALLAAWLFLLVSLGAAFRSMYTTERALRASLERTKPKAAKQGAEEGQPEGAEKHQPEEAKEEQRKGTKSEAEWNKKTRFWNNAAAITVVAGIALFTVFAGFNLPWQETTHARRDGRWERACAARRAAHPHAYKGTGKARVEGRVGDSAASKTATPGAKPRERR